jgi:DNA repair protein RadD
MYTPRWYQEEAIKSIFSYFMENDGNPIIALPTGTGKSIVIADFVKKVFSYYQGQRVMMLTHVKELIKQDYQKLIDVWPTAPAGIYSAGLNRRDHLYPITFAGIASVHKKPELFGKQDLAIIDECHLVSARSNTMYLKFIDAMRAINPALKVIGLTATKYRLGQGLLTEGKLFTDVCYDLTDRKAFARLVEENYLAPLVTKRTDSELDVSGIKIHAGEYVLRDLQEQVNKTRITQAAMEEAAALGKDRKKWLVFTTGVAHAEDTATILNRMGISAAAVHSKISSNDRAKYLSQFKNGELRALTNNNVLTTGFDFPDLDLIAVLRPTMSTGLWVQLLGRGTRPYPGKENCFVMDFAGNTRRLGPIDDPVIPNKKGKGSGIAPVKVCEKCMVYNHAKARFCVACGHEFHMQVKIEARAATREVMRLTRKPEVELIGVDRVIYTRHKKNGRPDSVKITYHCGIRVFNEWLCIEHPGYAGRKARQWWVTITKTTPPTSVSEALARVETLRVPSGIRVRLDTRFPEIVGRIYD